MNLTDLSDILDDLERRGNVPAGFSHCSIGGWRFMPDNIVGPLTQTPETRNVYRLEDLAHLPLAIASLCHTIEGVLMRERGYINISIESDGAHTCQPGVDMAFLGDTRLAAAAAAYRAHCLEKNDG